MGVLNAVRALWRRVCPPAAERRQERYSIELLCELSEYCKRKPLWYISLVVALSLLPSLATIVCLDAIQLQDPYSGWDRNPSFWVRAVLGTLALSVGVLAQLRMLAPAMQLTLRQNGVISVLASVNSQGVSMLIAKYWGVFPVPFIMLLATPFWTLTMVVCIYVAIGRERFAANPEIKIQLKRFLDLTNMVSMLLIVFPTYSAIFQTLEGAGQLAFVFVLPALKLVLKKLTKVVVGVEELVPVTIIAVDLFNALFQAKCMQNAGSDWTTAGIIAIDAIQNAYTLRRLLYLMADVQSTMAQHQAAGEATTSLLEYCVGLLESTVQLDLSDIRVRSWTPACLMLQNAATIRKCVALQDDAKSKVLPRGVKRSHLSSVAPLPVSHLDPVLPAAALVPRARSLLALTRVVPFADAPEATAATTESPGKVQTEILKKSLRLLWKCECVLLVEFIEFAAPLMYSISLGILYLQPNAEFYPGIASMSAQKLRSTLSSILLYSGLEFLSLLYMHATLKRTFRVSALHQLAFVLDTKRVYIQGVFMAWALIVLSFTLTHYGNDLTFQFKWMHRQHG